MKVPLQKVCKSIATVVCIITLFSSCSEENNPCDQQNNEDRSSGSKKATLILESFSPHDYGNDGNASDIFLMCRFSGELDRFEKLRFILKESATGFNMAKALTLPADSYVETNVEANVEVSFPAALKDADGMAVSEGNAYTIFILAVPSPCNGIPQVIEGPETLTLVDEIVVITPKLKSPLLATEDISTDSDNNLYISGGALNTTSLFKVSPDGTVTTLSTALNYPVGNTLDDNGNIYVTNFGNIDINLITPSGTTSVFARDERLFRGGGIAMDNEGSLYNTFWAIKTLYKITSAGVENFVTSNLFNGPVGVAYDKINDNIFVANFNDGKILRVSKDKTITEVADIPATIGHLEYRDKVFYATGWFEHKVFIVSEDGEILATIGNGTEANVDGRASEASFFRPNGIGVSKDGKFVYVTQGDGKLRKIVL
jgi:sugar lactone lactonase YvrE